MIARIPMRSNVLRALSRYYSEGVGQSQGSSQSSPPPSSVNVPGLSSAVVEPAAAPVGPNVDPNKAGPYKAPEYFCYNDGSFYEAEVEMNKYRLPQPSAVAKQN